MRGNMGRELQPTNGSKIRFVNVHQEVNDWEAVKYSQNGLQLSSQNIYIYIYIYTHIHTLFIVRDDDMDESQKVCGAKDSRQKQYALYTPDSNLRWWDQTQVSWPGLEGQGAGCKGAQGHFLVWCKHVPWLRCWLHECGREGEFLTLPSQGLLTGPENYTDIRDRLTGEKQTNYYKFHMTCKPS